MTKTLGYTVLVAETERKKENLRRKGRNYEGKIRMWNGKEEEGSEKWRLKYRKS